MEDLSTAERKAFMTLFKVTQGPGLKIIQAVIKAAFGISVARHCSTVGKKKQTASSSSKWRSRS
jgi:hypothetical protein